VSPRWTGAAPFRLLGYDCRRLKLERVRQGGVHEIQESCVLENPIKRLAVVAHHAKLEE